jgi:hypothetical protein
MRKSLGIVLIGFCLLFHGAPVFADEQARDVSLQGGISELSNLQALLEFFFMEAGVYPPTLEELNVAFNAQLPKGSKPVPMPKDPATGKDFIYTPGANHKGYVLSFPDATVYGLPAAFELRPVSWGWLALRAERKRFEEMVKLSKYHIESLATQVEMYAKDNGGAYPANLDQLYPKYIQRHPQDPVTGKNYAYRQLADGYVVGSPNPERYGLKIFQYSSSQGIQVEILPEK